jgi:hypothetical protein
MSFVLLMVATPWLEFLFIFFTLQHGYNRSKILIQEGRKLFSLAVAKENEGLDGRLWQPVFGQQTVNDWNRMDSARKGKSGLVRRKRKTDVSIDPKKEANIGGRKGGTKTARR